MPLPTLIADYVEKHRVSDATAAKMRYELSIWSRIGGSTDHDRIGRAEIETWRRNAVAQRLRPRTVESVIATVKLLCAHAGYAVETGRKLRHVPAPPPLPTWDEFCRLVESADPWWRWWLMAAYVTGFRLSDLETCTIGEVTQKTSAKMGKTHRIPVPPCVVRLARGSLRRPRKSLRNMLHAMCRGLGITDITPQVMRSFSATEWQRARPGCGAIILGHAIPGWTDATPYYLDGFHELELGLPHLRLPECIMSPDEVAARKSGESRLVESFRRLPPEKRASLVVVAEAMG